MKSETHVCDADSGPMSGASLVSHRVSETSRFNVLRLRYKAAFDAAKAIAVRNAAAMSNGGTISDEARAEELRAAEELQRASDEMMSSTARLGG
jgi:hypothetical protein